MLVKEPLAIPKLMAIQGISQREMARRVGYASHAYMGLIMKGDVKTVTPEKAALIANELGVGVDDLFLVRTSTDTGRNDQRKAS